ncbi:related to 28 kDa heat- and acid-stable phosphoprotein [Cephalotrichum gorgonifer]|uniref:Related to 28 kDa heat- and acid-stable phosphoprotein n=1 Tax=Cephalotrichum gorgonifer TaxID=2041049 RepID=A0AAE8SUI8_9PEZI|nr:related to 28 kDa heat- and acid-stable phosphoprotein [Cephalotrichum gorgonifer]
MSSRGAPGANSRGRGGKFKKFTRGGGKHFSRDLKPLDADGNEISMWSEDAVPRGQRGLQSDESESESEEDDDEEEEEQATLSREERKKEKKAKKEAAIKRKNAQAVEVGDLPPSDDEEEDEDDAGLANPNHSRAARKMVNARDPVDDVAGEVGKLSVASNRKERESADAQAARDRYQALHEQGKTDEAKSDLARLKIIREQRAAEAARRQAEKEEKEAQESARKAEREAKMAALDKKAGKKSK